MKLAQNIRNLRQSKNMTQVQLAKTLGVCKSNVWKYEHGQLLPPLDIVIKLSNLFDLSIDELVNMDLEEMEKTK